MAAFEKDFILRLVQQLAAMLARVLKLKQQKRYEEAEAQVAEAYADLFGIDPRFFPMMDARTVVAALGHPEKATAFVKLLTEQAELATLRGDAARAAQLLRRAAELASAIQAAPPGPA